MKILIAGGAGFIGSTVASACLDQGIEPIIVDNLVTGRREFTAGRPFYEGDICDGELIDQVFAEHHDIAAAIDCAALIVVPESVAQPLRYYTENVAKGIAFVGHLVRNGCQRLIFSSSASIYATGTDFGVNEDSPLDPMSPYARTKAVFETALSDIAAGGEIKVLSLRYFNPIGADPKMRSGLQIPSPSHALGKMIEAHTNHRPFQVTGTDWPTRDGSGIRDYVHVWDLARAHLAALQRFDDIVTDSLVISLGSGTGTTVRELVAAFDSVTGEPLEVIEAERRPGDNAGAFAHSDRAGRLLDWRAELSIEQGIRDTLTWFEIRPAIIGTPA